MHEVAEATGQAAVGAGGKDGAFVVALSNLFKDVADAIEANQDFLREGFGQEALLEVMSGLQQECDVQVILFCFVSLAGFEEM